MFTLMANELEGDHQVADDNGVPKEEKKPDFQSTPNSMLYCKHCLKNYEDLISIKFLPAKNKNNILETQPSPL